MKISKITLIAATLLLAACGSKEKKEQKQDKKPVVQIETVTNKIVDQVATYTATAEPEMVNNISSSMPNRIKSILVDEGMRVSKGQRLVVLDDVNTTSYQIQVNNAEAALQNVQTDYNRAVELFKIGGGTKQAVDQMEVQLINARNNLAAAKRALKNASENTVLTSPVSGVVTARNYDPGDMTGALPILTVSQVQPLKIVINVSESEFSRIHVGMPAIMTFDTYGDEEFKGVVSLISPTVDSQTRTFGVEIRLPNASNRVLPGMFGRVTLNLGSADRVVVPDRSIVKQTGSGNYYVYTYEGGKVKYNKVELGRRLGDSYELLSGVQPGASVVISGQSKLANGMAVDLAK